MKHLITFLLVTLVSTSHGQDTSDVARLKNLTYMEYAGEVNCDSISYRSIDQRICLNLKFQEVDSIMNARFRQLLSTIERDSIRNTLIDFHKAWVNNRRFHCTHKSEGYPGHMFGIVYLDCFVESTILRTKEIDYHISYEE